MQGERAAADEKVRATKQATAAFEGERKGALWSPEAESKMRRRAATAFEEEGAAAAAKQERNEASHALARKLQREEDQAWREESMRRARAAGAAFADEMDEDQAWYADQSAAAAATTALDNLDRVLTRPPKWMGTRKGWSYKVSPYSDIVQNRAVYKYFEDFLELKGHLPVVEDSGITVSLGPGNTKVTFPMDGGTAWRKKTAGMVATALGFWLQAQVTIYKNKNDIYSDPQEEEAATAKIAFARFLGLIQ